MNIASHELWLAKEAGTTVDTVRTITAAFARRLVRRAQESDRRCPAQAPWLETVLACNAAENRHARAIIEHRAREMAQAEARISGEQWL